jgi:adenylate cyclase class IV
LIIPRIICVLKLYLGDYNMKKGLAVFSGSAVVHKLMQDGTVVLGTAANPASVTISGSLTASANSVEVGNVGGEFTNHTLGGILVELKNSGSASSGSLKSYIDAQDIVVGNAAAAALGAYTASNNAALATETAARIAGDTSVRNDLSAALTASAIAASSSLEGVRFDLQEKIDLLAGTDLSGTLSSIADIKSFLDGQAGGVEGILDGFSDLSIAVNAISGALSQEIVDRAADVDAEQQRAEGVEEDLQDQINSLTTGSTQAVDNLRADFNTYTGSANGRLDTLESDLADEITRATGAEATLTSDLAAEVIRATGAESVLTADLASEVIRATAAEGALGVRIDGVEADLATEQERAEAAEVELASDIAEVASDLAAEITNRIADVDAEQDRAEAAELVLTQAVAAEVVRAELAEAGLQSAINTEKDRIDAILSGSTVDLDQFKEVVDFVNSIDTTNQNALISSITAVNTTASQMRADFSEYTSSNDAALAAEVSRASGVEAGLQSQIDASAFTVNGLSVSAKTGSFTIVTGSSNNLSIVNSGSQVKVDLNSSVTLAGALSANTLTASAGLSVVGGASVAGGMTVSSGDMKVSQGAMSVKMTREEAVARGAGEDGDMFYCTSATDNPASAFPRGSCWYFKQGGEWFDAPFFMG